MPAVPPDATAAAAAAASERKALERRRDELAEQVIELHWDLGGLTYEMAVRDHFRLDVLLRRAAVLQERDAELAEVERMLGMESAGVAGACGACSAPYSRGAQFCWQCGVALADPAQSAATLASDEVTAAMDALLAPGSGASGAVE